MRVWIVTDITGGQPGVFLDLFEKYQHALQSINISWSKRHVRIEKNERVGITRVKLEVFKGEGNDPSELHFYEVFERDVHTEPDHL